jgi:hypothetical protein
MVKDSVLKVLLACEESGTVRDAFTALGHDATSCDLLPSRTAGQHYQGDVRDMLKGEWDLVIAFPPCTDLAVSGARYFAQKREDGRQQASIDFFMLFTSLDCPWAIENPIGIMSSRYRKPDQIIQPWQYGHHESKATCLWLSGLPLLRDTKVVGPDYACKCGCRFSYELGRYGCPNCHADRGQAKAVYSNQTPSGQNKLGPSPDRAMIRSKTYDGIADAMAAQWSKYLLQRGIE